MYKQSAFGTSSVLDPCWRTLDSFQPYLTAVYWSNTLNVVALKVVTKKIGTTNNVFRRRKIHQRPFSIGWSAAVSEHDSLRYVDSSSSTGAISVVAPENFSVSGIMYNTGKHNESAMMPIRKGSRRLLSIVTEAIDGATSSVNRYTE